MKKFKFLLGFGLLAILLMGAGGAYAYTYDGYWEATDGNGNVITYFGFSPPVEFGLYYGDVNDVDIIELSYWTKRQP